MSEINVKVASFLWTTRLFKIVPRAEKDKQACLEASAIAEGATEPQLASETPIEIYGTTISPQVNIDSASYDE